MEGRGINFEITTPCACDLTGQYEVRASCVRRAAQWQVPTDQYVPVRSYFAPQQHKGPRMHGASAVVSIPCGSNADNHSQLIN